MMGGYKTDKRDQVKATLTMLEVLSILGFEPPNREGKISSLQNRDERTPSLHIYEKDWFDYSTGKGGDVIDFAMQAKGLTYHEALERLSDKRFDPMRVKKNRPGIKPMENLSVRFREEPEATGQGYQKAEQFVERKWPFLQIEDLLDFGVKATDTELWTPHEDASGIIRGVKIRSTSNGSKRAVTGSTFTSQLYKVRELESTPLAVLVEGESDLWCVEKWLRINGLASAAFGYALPSGAATWRPNWKDSFNRHQHTLVCLDDDLAGKLATDRILEELKTATAVAPPGGRVAEAIETADQWLTHAILSNI